MFSLDQLEHLAAFADYGTLSQTAKILHLSQPALSRSMQKLEDELRIPLFDRSKNKIVLNENGVLAAEYAKKILNLSQDMATRLRLFDQSRLTITVGSCAPAPIWELTPLLYDLYPDMPISVELKSDEYLIQSLMNHIYDLVATSIPIEKEGVSCTKYTEEHLCFSLPANHPLAGRSSLCFQDLDGEHILLRARLGAWQDIPRRKMPHAQFHIIEEWSFYNENTRMAALPTFATELSQKHMHPLTDRAIIPIADSEAHMNYYLSYLTGRVQKIWSLLHFLAIL